MATLMLSAIFTLLLAGLVGLALRFTRGRDRSGTPERPQATPGTEDARSRTDAQGGL